MKEKIKIAGFLVAMLGLCVFLTLALEEKPHRVVINGKNYMRMKEYTGNGHYEIILIPEDNEK